MRCWRARRLAASCWAEVRKVGRLARGSPARIARVAQVVRILRAAAREAWSGRRACWPGSIVYCEVRASQTARNEPGIRLLMWTVQFTRKAQYVAPLCCRFADPHHGAVLAAFGKSRYGKTHSRPEKGQGKIRGKAFTICSGAV